jgi:hypothetical protein
MKDFLEKELTVGDEVIFVHYMKGSSQYLMKGKIIEIKMVGGREIAKMDSSYKGVTKQNIYKI